MDLSFSIDKEFRNGELFLIVHVMENRSSRILYLPTLKEFGKTDKDLASFLIAEHCKESGILPSSSSASTLACNKIRIRSSKAWEGVQKLLASKRLLWKGRSLFFNPLSKTSIAMQAKALEGGGLELMGFLSLDGREDPLSDLEFLFLGDPVFGIFKQMLFVLPKSFQSSWLEKMYPDSSILEGKVKQRFLEDYQEDPPEDFPKVRWIGTVTPDEAASSLLPVYPCLVLKDSKGAFADLKMEYETKIVDYFDPCRFLGRDLVSERGWEKDLLETDYVVKMMNSSSYYCPTDKVASSLCFLLEIGWKIIDSKGRRLVRLGDLKIEVLSKPEAILVRGSLRYGEHQVDLKEVVGAFNRQESFVKVGESSVALLEGAGEYEGLQDLVDSDLVSEGCLLSSKKWGLLDRFLQRKDLTSDANTKTLLDRLKSAQKEKVNLELENFQGDLRPYQKEGVDWLYFLHQNGLSGLLADEMGLGKTVQTLAFLSKIETSLPILIVVPTSLVFNWKKEWEAFLPYKKLYVHEGKKRSNDLSFLKEQEAILTSYALLRLDFLLLEKVGFSCIILDEAQWIKNADSQLAQAAYRLQAPMKICLTGTPVENRADDLWSLFHFLEPELLGEKKDFLASLDAAALDKRHSLKIRKLIRPLILRRVKEEVAQDLPEKIEQEIWLEMQEGQRQFYEDWLSKTKLGLLKKVALDGGASHRMEILEAILRLRQICCHPALVSAELQSEEMSAKLQRVLEDLSEVVLEGRKVLVYSQFTKMLGILRKKVEENGWRYAYLDGDTKDRESAVSSFQTDPNVQIFLISLKAGGVGLNLTAADYVFLMDPWWNEAVEKQAIDRAHRFGRKGAVIARRYVIAESIEEKIMKLKKHKVFLAEGLLTLDMEASSVSLEEMIALLE
jgi:superfamily II DNA or RNA helicase